MTTQISEANIQPATLAALAGGGGPKISSVQVTNSSYTNLDDTAVDLTGGFVKLIGSGFEAGCQVLVGLTPATSVTFVSATEVRAQLPATAAGTYIVYLVNSDGGTAIRVNGVTFSGTPAWLSNSTLAGEADTLISIQLAATDATTFALAAGSTLPPGVSLSSSGLLSGTITGISQETVYNFTINAVDAELQDSPRAFAFTVTSGDPLFALTTLLLPGSVNTFVRDLSTNNATATVFGDTRPSTFNPYLTGWSNFFDGTGDHLTLNSITTSGDFTLEFWAYRTAAVSSFMIPFSAGGNNGWVGWMTNSTTFVWDSVVTATVPDTINTWAHYAVVRQGTTARIYVNGVQCGSASTSANLTFSTIGMFGTGSLNYTGYLSNVRLVNGTAVYTAAFTPPTQPLTAISGTSLLTCQSNRFRDASPNNLVITRTGDVVIDSFSPFVEPATTNGSAYFDGTGDYLLLNGTSAIQFGSGNFTMECWIYTGSSAQQSIYGDRSGGNFSGIVVSLNNYYVSLLMSAGSAWDINTFSNVTGTQILPNTWTHIAVVRSGNNINVYTNGNLNYTRTFSGSLAQTSTVRIASEAGGTPDFNGYISNFRIVKGTAVYTDAFTAPTQPLTAVSGTGLLTLQTNQPHNNRQFLDSSTENFLITRSGNTTQGSFSPYSPSGWSNYFDGSGDYLTVPANAAFDFGTGDFTVEAWVYLNTGVTEASFLSGTAIQSTDLVYTANSLRFGRNNLAWDTTINHTLATNVWQHIAFVKESGVAKIYVNGSLIGSAANTNSYSNQNGNILINASRDLSRQLAGYISNHRVVKGTAVYTANFTPPTQPLTAIPRTSLLTCCDNRFIDDSPNNFAITRNGDVRVVNFSPFRAVTQTPRTYSAYFDNTGDYLTLATNAAFGFGTGAFTIECWFNPQSITAAGGDYLFDMRTTNVQAALLAYINTTGGLDVFINGAVVITGGTVVVNTWNHFALTKSGTTTRMFLNGTQVGSSYTDNLNYGSTAPVTIASRFTAEDFYQGYISNFRIVKGTALYTANFTPPTAQLTAVADTSLLTCQSPTFVDNSSNRFAVTAFGNSQPSMVNPFGFTFANSAGYSVAAHGGSIYFDGSDDSISVPANSAIGMGTGNFTIEFWMYQATAGDNKVILDLFDGNSAGRLLLFITTSNGQLINRGSFGAERHATATGAITLNSWIHVALVRSAGISRFYINGVQSGSNFTDSTNYTCTAGPVRIGTNQDGTTTPLTGYITDFRMVKGTALYTSNFVPPLAPVQPVPGTTLLLNGTAAAISDPTTKNALETVGTAAVSTAVSKFGGSSINFPSTESWLRIRDSDAGVFGTGNFTVEMWVFFPENLASTGRLIAFTNSTTATAGRLTQGTGNSLQWTDAANLNGFGTGANIPVSLNTWTHVAVCRSGTTLRYFKDGVQVASGTDSSNYTIRDISVGADHAGNWRLTCSIQDLRITKAARYTGNFTPPTAAFVPR